jgi:hypothetical protein
MEPSARYARQNDSACRLALPVIPFRVIRLLAPSRENSPSRLRQFVLFLFSAISAMFSAVTTHREEIRDHPATATKPALTALCLML